MVSFAVAVMLVICFVRAVKNKQTNPRMRGIALGTIPDTRNKVWGFTEKRHT